MEFFHKSHPWFQEGSSDAGPPIQEPMDTYVEYPHLHSSPFSPSRLLFFCTYQLSFCDICISSISFFPQPILLSRIFVKSVKDRGPAVLAGLNIGDRLVSVNGETVAGRTYAQVVQMIQKSRDSLFLVVVPRQDDILQVVSITH